MTTSPSVPEEIVSALLAWRNALTAIVHRRLGAAPSVRVIAAELGIGRGAAHAVSQVLVHDDPTSMGAALPGIKTRQLLLDRLGQMDIDPERLRTFAMAQERLENLLRRHAPSKVALISLLAGSSPSGPVQSQLLAGLRKRFESDAMLLGGSAEHLLAAQFFAPASDGRHVDMAAVQLLDTVQQWRSDAEIDVYRALAERMNPTTLVDAGPGAIVPAACSEGWSDRIATFPQTNDGPIQRLRPRSTSEASNHPTLRLGFGEAIRGVGPMTADEPGDTAEMGCPVWLPIRTLVLECWLHRDLRRGGSPTAAIYHSLIRDFRPGPERERFRVHVPTPLTNLGSDWSPPDDLRDPEPITAYRLLTNLALQRLGATVDDFEIHRLVLSWAPTAGLITISWPLADPTSV